MCNLCVTGLDESLGHADLHQMFSKFGQIKSAKVAIDHKTHKSKCYGHVWFMQEDSCMKAIAESQTYQNNTKMPYLCAIFEMSGLRHAKNFIREGYHTVTVINYPSCYTADELKSIFSHAPILNMSILPRKVLEKSSSWPEVQTRAEITFQSTVDAREACMLNGVKIRDTQLQVRPSDHQPAVMSDASKSMSTAPKPPVTTDGEFEISTFTGNFTGKPT